LAHQLKAMMGVEKLPRGLNPATPGPNVEEF